MCTDSQKENNVSRMLADTQTGAQRANVPTSIPIMSLRNKMTIIIKRPRKIRENVINVISDQLT